MFNRLLLISCICIVIALLLYFFHWNRFLGFLIGRLIRLMYWNKDASSIWVEIGSVHFSLIAGRILLKDVRYHSSNQTVKIVKGQVQWRYWIRRPTSEEEIRTDRGGEDQRPTRSMDCRIQVSFQGFEWFLYNRTAAYENIVSQMETGNPSRPVSRSTEHGHSFPKSRAESLSPFYPPSFVRRPSLVPQAARKAIAWVRRQLPSLDPKDLLPLGIQVTKGAIICGNSSTPNLLVAEFRRAEGTFGIVQSKSKFDLYKQVISLKFQHTLIRYVRNEDYVDPMTTIGELVHGRIVQYSTLSRASSYLFFRLFIKLWRQLGLAALTEKYTSDRRELHTLQQQEAVPRIEHKKLRGAVDDSTPIGADFFTFEYAVERKILEAPFLELLYYADAVGDVPQFLDQTERMGEESIDVGNGDAAPEWGFDIIVSGGFLRYGPWADRQRAELQKAFFPPTYHDGATTPYLKPGDKRIWTEMRVFVELRDSTTLYIPFREASKDWQWDGKTDIPQRPRVREPAEIRLTVGDCSSINYVLPMVTGPSGYQPVLEVHLDTITVTSSLNDIRLATAESCRVHCELPSPLRWDGERKWTIAVSLRKSVLYLIREHINMFTDLGKDWAAGAPSDYQRFIPMIYLLKLELYHFELNMYANDHNIIDKPLNKDENALLTYRGAHFTTEGEIPLNTFRPESTTIPFYIEAPDVQISLSLPRWNTNAVHAPKDGNSIAKVRLLRIDGSYQYFADVREEHVEQFKLKFTVRDVALKGLGWSIRYFMVLRDNYLGSFTHFSTLYEFLDRKKRNLPLGDPVIAKYREGKANVLQAEIQLYITGGTVILPTGLPGYESPRPNDNDNGIGACFVFTIPEIQLQFRMHDYYMEMSLNVNAISGHLESDYPEKVTYVKPRQDRTNEIFLVDGLDVTANRLFGPQPRTATYVCIWEIRLGSIKALLSASEARLLTVAANAFRHNYTDSLNAPAAEYLPAVDPDVTFYKFSLATLDLTWRAGHAALGISLSRGVKVDSNDLGGRYHRRVSSLRVPDICIKVLLAAFLESNRWLEAAELTTDAYMDIYTSPRGYLDTAKAQITFIEEQDRPTSRARHMFGLLRSRNTDNTRRRAHENGLYLPQPEIPKPRHPEKNVTSQHRDPIAERPARSWRLSSLSQLSESDGEEGISEADRDARLARTRSSTPVLQADDEDDQNMTSGDESDDEDLTDASSNSDWSDLGGTTDAESDIPFLVHYSHILRQYTARHLGSPDLWDGPPFVLTRDRTPLGLSHAHASQVSGEPKHDVPFLPKATPDLCNDQDYTSLRFKCCKIFQIKLTPLILPAILHLEEDMERNPLGPELWIDSLMSTYLGAVSASKRTESYTLFEVFMPSTVIHIIQRIIMTDGHPAISRNFSETSNASSLDAVAVIQGDFDGINMSGSFSNGRITVNAGFDRLAVSLKMSFDKRTVQSATCTESAFNCGIDDFTVDLRQDRLEINWGKTVVQIGHHGPEYMTATCIALARNVKQLIVAGQRWKTYASALSQNIVSDIIRFSDNKAIVDPLSTIQPSYLVQSGTPHKLRTDITFKFLFHLRNCLWHLEDGERPTFRSIHDDVKHMNMEDLASLLESRLIALDQDAYSVADLSLLEPLFPGLRIHGTSQERHFPGSSLGSVSVQFIRLAVVVLDPSSHNSPSEFAVTDVHVNARIKAFQVISLPSAYSTSMSQISLKDKHSQRALKTSASVYIGDLTLTVFPHLMRFAQHILRVRRHYNTPSSLIHESSPSGSGSGFFGASYPLLTSSITFSLRCLRIQAAAENLVFEFGISGMQGISSLLMQSHGRQSRYMNHSVLFEEVYVRARSPADTAKRSDQDILASLEITGSTISSVSRQDQSSRINIRLVFAIAGFRFIVPRSALRLYRFAEEWRADFLPDIEATVQALLSELKKAPTKSISPTASRSSSLYPSLEVQGQLTYFGISLQVMHGTWLSYEANLTTAYFNSSKVSSSAYTFGLQITSTALSISSKPNTHDGPPSTRFRLVLPSLSLTGHHDGVCIQMLALVDFVELKVKPSHWDTLLVVQQKFGQDFNDLVALIQETHLKRSASSTRKSVNHDTELKYMGFLKIRGFRVGLEGLSSTIYLECLDIGGGLNNSAGLAWHINLSDLAFSLAPRAVVGPHYSGFSRNHRSAFVIIDFRVNAGNKICGTSANKVVQLTVTKIHAVMQPSSIGEVGDFIDYLQAEMLDRKEQRALELAAFKAKTQSILKTFEVGVRDTQISEKSSWLDDYTIDISTRNIGVAFPLTHDRDLELPPSRNRDSDSVRAFLFSIKSIEFGTQRGETGQAIMKNFSFQFVSRFRQSVSGDFSGENHQTRNRLVYPEMEARLRSKRSATSRHIWMSANVSGFILDLDSNIPSYIFSLIDVYRRGKDRVERLSVNTPRTPSTIEIHTEKAMNLEERYTAPPTSNVFASFTFLSGKVRAYSGSASNLYRTKSFSHTSREPSDEQIMELGAEVFNLPVVSVWAEYRASQKLSLIRESEPSILMFKSTVHSSQNTLRPTLLPFLTELVDHVETRLRKVSLQTPHPISAAMPEISTVVMSPSSGGSDSMSSMRISFSLRIDQSKLELTCQPDVNVLAGLHWDNGGFVVNVSPGARRVTFTGSVGGLTLGLKHGFLSEDCVKLDARNLAFSVTFAKVESDNGTAISSISAILDTEFLGAVRFSRLQDILCFKAVWLDRIPVFSGQSTTTHKTRSSSSANLSLLSQPVKQEFTTVILVRIRQITLEIDLGQSISVVSLDLKEAIMRTKLTDVLSEVSIFVAELTIAAKGNIAGHARVPKCVFQTIRSTEYSSSNYDERSRMLELRMTSGALIATLESDHQKLLHYRAEPLEVKIFDDWSAVPLVVQAADRPLQLSFTVMSPEIVAVVTVGTIPKLLAYVNKFKANLDAQRQGASRESKAFRVTRSPKPENPLSAVAEAMLHSARSRFKEADSGLSYVIMQHMSLRLDLLRLVVFPRTMDDLEIAHFIGRDVHAGLDRLVESELNPGKRDLHLSFSSMTISKFTQLGHPSTSDLSDGRQWLISLLNNAVEAIIVGLPSMTMHMVSEETVDDLTTILLYDFYSKFVRREGMRDFEDIYITLNVSLYSWLTLLRKNLTREMDQVKATTDWRALLSSASPNPGIVRQKAPEPLSLTDSPRSSTLPHPISSSTPPFSPSTALKSSIEQSRSATSEYPPSSPSAGDQPSQTHWPFPSAGASTATKDIKRIGITYRPRIRHIERLTMRQLGEATPDVMHPFFMKKAGFNLEDSLPQYVNEYATAPLEEIMEVLLKLYSRQLLAGNRPT